MSQAEIDDLIIFYHVPKCGGTTISRIIDNAYDRSSLCAIDPSHEGFDRSMQSVRDLGQEAKAQLRMVRGHHTYGLHKFFQRPCKYVTIIRDPAYRFISYFRFITLFPNTPRQKQLAERGISLVEMIEAGDEALGFDNLVRSFAGAPEAASAQDGSEFVELAMRNLARDFEVVGITERMDETALLMSEKLGWPLRGYRNHNVNSRYDRKLPRPVNSVMLDSPAK